MRLHFSIILLTAIISSQVLGEDFSWVETDELKLELNSRRDDLTRTSDRISELQHQLLAQQNEKMTIEQALSQVDAKLVQRTSMLYRLSRNGKSVQYLFSSDSMTAFLKRMQTLKLLVTSQMDEKRDLTLQLTRIEDDIQRTREQISGAKDLSTQLTAMVQNLQREISQRTNSRFLKR